MPSELKKIPFAGETALAIGKTDSVLIRDVVAVIHRDAQRDIHGDIVAVHCKGHHRNIQWDVQRDFHRDHDCTNRGNRPSC